MLRVLLKGGQSDGQVVKVDGGEDIRVPYVDDRGIYIEVYEWREFYETTEGHSACAVYVRTIRGIRGEDNATKLARMFRNGLGLR